MCSTKSGKHTRCNETLATIHCIGIVRLRVRDADRRLHLPTVGRDSPLRPHRLWRNTHLQRFPHWHRLPLSLQGITIKLLLPSVEKSYKIYLTSFASTQFSEINYNRFVVSGLRQWTRSRVKVAALPPLPKNQDFRGPHIATLNRWILKKICYYRFWYIVAYRYIYWRFSGRTKWVLAVVIYYGVRRVSETN